MYGLIPYQLTGMQGGIQFMHAAIEYANEFSDTPEYYRWSRYDKTVIVLNGGTTNTNPNAQGTLNKHLTTLLENNITQLSKFYEPDLGDQMTAIVFLVDDRVWDKENFPDYVVPYEELDRYKSNGKVVETLPSYKAWVENFSEDPSATAKIVFLRTFLKQFRFA
jgi:hypothetical protein